MGIFDMVNDLITEHGSSAIKSERIIQLREQAQAVEEKCGNLEDENRDLKEKVSQLERELEEKSVPEDFVEYRGVLFRRRADGFESEAYCPSCKIPMTSLHGLTPLRCSKCQRRASFPGKHIPVRISELQG